jgi:tRNA(His) 5'-end guanylyltransferase
MVRRNATFVVNALNHPAYWAFRRWKYQEADAQDKLKSISKSELIEKII